MDKETTLATIDLEAELMRTEKKLKSIKTEDSKKIIENIKVFRFAMNK